MGTISSSQMSQIFLSRYGVELNPSEDGSQAPAANPGQAANPNANPPGGAPQPPPRAVQTELNRLMRNFASETYSTTEVNKLLAPAQNEGASSLEKADKKAIQKLAKKAANAFAAIDKLTVQDILNKAGPGSKTEKLFEKAADLQFQLGNMLRELSAGDKYRREGLGEFRVMLDDISFKCDSRGSEIMTLLGEVRAFGEKLKASKIGDNADFRKTSVKELVKGMAGSMHGNDKSLLFKSRIDSIEARLAQFSNRIVIDNPNDLVLLLNETERLRDDLMKPNVAQSMDRDIHAALTAHLGSIRTKLNDCVDKSLKVAERGLLKQFGEMNQLGKNIAAFIAPREAEFPVLGRLMRSLSRLESEELKIGDSIGVFDEIRRCLQGNDGLLLHQEIIAYRRLPSRPALKGSVHDESQVGSLLKQIGYPNPGDVLYMVKRTAGELAERRRLWGDGEADKLGKLSGFDVVNAFRRNDGLSMVVEARVHGANVDDINPQLCDKNLVEKSKLGSGAANTVYKMTYKMPDGSLKDYVFKPDLGGRIGLDDLMLGDCAYMKTQQAVKLNTATCDVADLLGLGRLTGRNYATVHRGQYGLLMEMAPGTTGEKTCKDWNNRSKFDSISVVGKLAKELNDLRWLDIATGQGDRHYSNYLVDFGEDDQTPKVTAIDNDMSFMPYMVGVGKCDVKHDDDRFNCFAEKLKSHCSMQDYDTIMAKIVKNNYVVDVNTASKEEILALREAFGFHALVVPRQMSRSLCNRLKAFKDEEIKAFADKLAKNVDKKEGVAATIQRLKDLREIAERYDRDGRVVEDDQWNENAVKKEMECPALLTDENRGIGENNQMVDYLMSSTLSRDFKLRIPERWR